nr:hypothetical protein [Tanacetum cinerariifolium]
MPVTRQGTNDAMTPESIQAMVDQAIQRNYTHTHDDVSQSSGGGLRRPVQPVRVCSYTDFMKCQPLNFKGTEGVVGLSQWLEKMKSVFHIIGCVIDNQVKFATCTLLGAALTWWNGHVRTLGHDAVYAMTWGTLKKKLMDKYCPKGKIKKLEIEPWNLRVKGNDVAAYTQCFQELALMCTKFLADETKQVDNGLPDNIHGNVMSAKPKTLNETIELANDLMDQKLRTYAKRQNENKRKTDNNQQQQSHKKQNVARAYTAGPGKKKVYTGDLPLCTKCNYHHTGQCAPKCGKCKRPNDEALRKCILSGPYKPTTVLVQAVEATDNSPAVLEHTTVETPTNMPLENKAHFLAGKEMIHLILTGIGDDIYLTVDACQTVQEMWEAIERLQQGEFLNTQDVKTNLFWEFGKFTLHDGESMESYYTRFYKLMNEMIRNNLSVTTMQVNVQFLQQLQPEWSRFVTIVKQQHKLDEVSYHKLFDILKQYQNEVNELRAEKLARNANPLALVANAQADRDPFYQSSRSHRSSAPSSKPSIPSRSHTSTRHKGKEITKPITPPSETAFEEDNDPEQAQRDKDMKKNLALIAKYFKKIYKPTNNNVRTSSNSKSKNVDMTPRFKNDSQSGQFGNQRTVNVAGTKEKVGSQVVQQSGIQCFNCKEYGHFTKECRKPKRVKDSAYHKEKMLLCKQAEQGVPLQSEQYDWLADTDEEVNEQELEAHYSYMAKIQENEQNDVESDDDHVALANLIANLKLDVDENKKIQKQLKKANTTLAQELK